MINAVLFDLDGVLVDTEAYSTEASNKVLADVGIIQTPEEKVLVFGRRTRDNYIAAINARGLDVDVDELVKRKNELFAKIIRGNVEPMPGVMALLANLKENKIKVAVVSSSPLDRVNVTLDEVGLILEFDVIVSGDCCKMGKPNPEPFLLAAERVGVNPSECVVVEDAEAGVRAGKAAGMKVLAVESPNTHGQDITSADGIVKSLEGMSLKTLERL